MQSLWKLNQIAVNVVTPPVVDMSPTLDSLKSIIQKQIKAQLKFSKSCKTGTAKWKFQGLCHSVEVFKALTGSDAKFKRKKISLDEFNKIIDCYDGISASIRYGRLSVNGDVSLNWDPNSLEFSFIREILYSLKLNTLVKWVYREIIQQV